MRGRARRSLAVDQPRAAMAADIGEDMGLGLRVAGEEQRHAVAVMRDRHDCCAGSSAEGAISMRQLGRTCACFSASNRSGSV